MKKILSIVIVLSNIIAFSQTQKGQIFTKNNEIINCWIKTPTIYTNEIEYHLDSLSKKSLKYDSDLIDKLEISGTKFIRTKVKMVKKNGKIKEPNKNVWLQQIYSDGFQIYSGNYEGIDKNPNTGINFVNGSIYYISDETTDDIYYVFIYSIRWKITTSLSGVIERTLSQLYKNKCPKLINEFKQNKNDYIKKNILENLIKLYNKECK